MLPTEVTNTAIINARENLHLLVAIRDTLDKVVHEARLKLMRAEDAYYADKKEARIKGMGTDGARR